MTEHYHQPLNYFEEKVAGRTTDGLYSLDINTIQVNVGFRCNQECKHCHLECSPARTEMMEWQTMRDIKTAALKVKASLVDITGGAPELNPHLRKFISELHSAGLAIQVRTNLTILLEDDQKDTIEFFRAHDIRLVASLPCYLEENVTAQRGPGVYQRSVEAIRRLNTAGYGIEGGLQLNLVYNPGGPVLPPRETELEPDYRRELKQRFGISFTKLITIANMPIGRFNREIRKLGREQEYMKLLEESFNPRTVDGLMCRHQISVGWDGTIYDCDFNLALHRPVNHGLIDNIRFFDPAIMLNRRIVTDRHCFGCTAGQGSSCGGSLA